MIDTYTNLLKLRQYPVVGKYAYFMLKILGVEIPKRVKIGKNFILVHGGFGVVIHPSTTIEDDVRIYPGVTIGRGDVYRPADESEFKGIKVCSGVIIGTGAKILCNKGTLTIGRDTMIGANAVLTNSTGEGEIWAGIPAKLVGHVDKKYCSKINIKD